MQRVNQAYAANDLLALLELQLEIEQIDASDLANANAARLKQFNQVLSNQLNDLKGELARLEARFRFVFGTRNGTRPSPDNLMKSIDRNASTLRADLAQQKRDMAMLADREATKRWLKSERRRQRDDPFDLPF